MGYATEEQARQILDNFEQYSRDRADHVQDTRSALKVALDMKQRLRELGWSDGIHCPKDGSLFNVIEFGSTGVHTAHYDGDWPDGHLWIHAAGDLWPSHPRGVMWRPKSKED